VKLIWRHGGAFIDGNQLKQAPREASRRVVIGRMRGMSVYRNETAGFVIVLLDAERRNSRDCASPGAAA
jgi:hypothetical protein